MQRRLLVLLVVSDADTSNEESERQRWVEPGAGERPWSDRTELSSLQLQTQ
jgi:hypothetical protein